MNDMYGVSWGYRIPTAEEMDKYREEQRKREEDRRAVLDRIISLPNCDKDGNPPF